MWKNPRRFVHFRERISGEEFLDAAFRDDAGGIMARMIRVSALLTDKRGLMGSVVHAKYARTFRGSECAKGTFLRTIRGRNQDDQFAGS